MQSPGSTCKPRAENHCSQCPVCACRPFDTHYPLPTHRAHRSEPSNAHVARCSEPSNAHEARCSVPSDAPLGALLRAQQRASRGAARCRGMRRCAPLRVRLRAEQCAHRRLVRDLSASAASVACWFHLPLCCARSVLAAAPWLPAAALQARTVENTARAAPSGRAHSTTCVS